MNDLTLPKLAMADAFDWEDKLLTCIPIYERELVATAEAYHRSAVSILSDYRKRDMPAVNLGVVLRVRKDVLGPRITWVRFKGKARHGAHGKFAPTEPIRMHGKYRYSDRIFSGFDEWSRDYLSDAEDGFSILRYRTERLAALRDLCRQRKT